MIEHMPRLGPPDFYLRGLARQLGGPSGPLGLLVARQLNKGNRATIAAAVDALELTGNEVVADIGFGGGVGLDLLLDRTSATVHGVDPAPTMIARARRTRGAEVASGHLRLHAATMSDLPFDDGVLDGWISLNTTYFVDDLDSAFSSLARVLAPVGRGVLGIADPDWMASQAFTRHGFLLRPVDEVVQALEAAGLVVDRRCVGRGEVAYYLLVCRRG